MSQGHSDFDSEPIPGLPERLPEGERILWQGAPDWKVLALSAFHVGAVAVYFAVLMVWRGIAMYEPGDGMVQTITTAIALWPLAVAALATLSVLAWFSSRTTIYTITSQRVVLRIGIALSTTINIPFRVIESAALRERRGGTGDIPLTLKGPDRIGFVHLWPHVRPWRLAIPEPMLRAVPNAAAVARLLSSALEAALKGEALPASVGLTGGPRVAVVKSEAAITSGVAA